MGALIGIVAAASVFVPIASAGATSNLTRTAAVDRGFDVAAARATRPARLPATANRHDLLDRTVRSTRASVQTTDATGDSYFARGDLVGGKIGTDLTGNVPTLVGVAWVDPYWWTNPLEPDWQSDNTYVVWQLDVTGDEQPDYYLLFDNYGGTLSADVYDRTQHWKCAGDWAYDAQYGAYLGAAPMGCLGNPSRLRVTTKMGYDDLSTAGPVSTDLSPDRGFSAWLTNDVMPTKPTAPRTPTVTAGHASLEVNWPAVANPPGASITDYVVQYSPAWPVSWTTFADGVSASPHATITGLSNHASYIVRVAAKNRLGTSTWSPQSAARTPLAPVVLPSAPSKPLGVPGNRSIAFEWIAPPAAGTSPVTDYVVQTSTDGGAWITRGDGVRTSPTVTIGSVAPTSSVRLRVAAKSSAGQGPWSPVSDPTRPFTLPGAPTGVTASPRDGGLWVTWLPPASDGGSPVVSYTVRYHATGTKLASLPRSTPTVPTTPITPSVVGGTGAQISDLPWQVEVEVDNGNGLCGGTLVDTQWVITAAHCASGQTTSSVKVHSGITYRSAMSGGNAIGVTQVIVHPGYQSDTKQNDIALLHLASAAPGGAPAPLYTDPSGPAVGTSAVISGWGTLSSGGSLPDQLQRATVQVMGAPGDTCGSYGTPPDTTLFDPAVMLCAGAVAGGVDTCQGDSGGPLVVNVAGVWRLAGVTSFGNGCADPLYPGVYTRVSAFASWVQGYVTSTWPSVTVTCGAVNCTHADIPSLANGDNVQVHVVARNAFGLGAASSTIGPITVGAHTYMVPSAPTHVVAEPHDRRIHLTWAAPAASGGTPVYDYLVDDGVTVRRVGSASRSLDITGLTNGVPVSFRVTAVNMVGHSTASATSSPVSPGASSYVPLSGVRVMDTRATGVTVDGVAQRTGAIHTPGARVVRIGGRAAIPVSVRAVALNVLVPAPAVKGSLTLYACGSARPLLPNVHFAAGVDTTLLVVTNLSPSGTLCVATSTPVHVVLDAQGYFPSTARYTVVPTARLATGIRPAGSTLTFGASRRGGLPATVKAVVVKVTAASATAGSVVVYPCTTNRTSSLSLSTGGGRPVNNLMVLPPSATGTLCLWTSTSASVSVDAVGYLPTDAQYTALPPRRMADTRATGATVDGLYARLGTRAAKAGLAMKAAGRAGIAGDASAVTLSVTVRTPAAAGTLRVTACSSTSSGINISYAAGQTVTNTVISRIGAAGKVCISSSIPVDIVVDANGWFPRV